MTMVRLHRCEKFCTAGAAGSGLWGVLITLLLAASAVAQDPPVHFQNAGAMPPGAIGRLQLQRGGPLSGYFQPVEIRAPQGALISTAEAGMFTEPQPSPALVGMHIGAVYRLRVTRIAGHPGAELFPTVEVIDRLYPPPGEATRFPIPIVLTQTELQLALEGNFVTRVIYLEDPNRALPEQDNPHEQIWFEAPRGQDPLEVADRMGRPVAILRLGGRTPDAEGPSASFLYGSPPLVRFTRPEPIAEEVVPPMLEAAPEASGQ